MNQKQKMFEAKMVCKVRRWFILIISMALLIISVGSLSKHNGGFIRLPNEEGEVVFTQSSLHYLGGFKYYLLGTTESEYTGILQEQILEKPVKDTIRSYEASYSNRNIVAINYFQNDSLFGAFSILFVTLLIFFYIGFPLTLFVYTCIEFQLKSDQKLSFEWLFLLTGFLALLLSRFLFPVYGFKAIVSGNLILYIVLSFIAYIGLKIMNNYVLHQPTTTLKRQVIVIILLVILFVSSTGNFIHVLRLNEVQLGSISFLDTSKILIRNSKISPFSGITLGNIYRSADHYQNIQLLNWDNLLRTDITSNNLVNYLLLYGRIFIGLGFMILIIRIAFIYDRQKAEKVVFKRYLIIFLVLYIIYLWMNVFSSVVLRYKILEFSDRNLQLIIFPTISSIIPIGIMIYLLIKLKRDNLLN